MKVLVTGGVRSGKSHHAETLVAESCVAAEPSAPDRPVTYVAAGPRVDEESDPDWADRVRRHRERRPAEWVTVESFDLAAAVRGAGAAVLIDCLGTWVTRLVDHHDLWEAEYDDVLRVVDAATDDLLAAMADAQVPVVLVTNEVGMGVIPSHRSGRLFRDLLGTVNRRVAAGCDEVHLVVAGRVLVL